MVRPAFTDGMCTSTSWKVCWSHWRAGPFPLALWEVLLLSFSNTFPSTAVHNQSPHPALVFCLNPVSVRDPGIYIRLGGSGQHVCRRRECVYVCLGAGGVPPLELFRRAGCDGRAERWTNNVVPSRT